MANIVPYVDPLMGEYLQRIRYAQLYADPSVLLEGQLGNQIVRGLSGGGAGGNIPPTAPPPPSAASGGGNSRKPQGTEFTRRQIKTGLGQQRPMGYSVSQSPGKPFLPNNWLGKGFALGAPAVAAYNTLGATPEELQVQSGGTGIPGLDAVGAFATNLGSALTLGTIAPETLAATGRNAEAWLSGAAREPYTNAGREQGAALDYLRQQIADTANQIVAIESTGVPAQQLRDKHAALIVAAREVEAGTIDPKTVMPTEAPTSAPTAAPQMPFSMQMPSITGPYVGYGYNKTTLPAYPEGPDYTAAAPALMQLDPNALQGALFGGAAGAGLQTDPMASPSNLLFNLAMGLLGGRADYLQERGATKKESTREQNAFQRWLAEQQQENAAREAAFNLNVAQMQQGDNQFAAQMSAKRAEQLQPKITDGYAVVPRLENGQIRYDFKMLPDPKLMYGGMLTTPDDIYQTILGSPGGVEALTKLSQDMDLSLPAKFSAAGVNDKTIANTAVAQIVNAFAAQFPAEFQQIQQEAIMRRALEGR